MVGSDHEITGVARIAVGIDLTEILFIERVDIVYSVDDWRTTQRVTADYAPSSQTFVGAIPAQNAGTIVKYYVEAFDNLGSNVREPFRAPESSFIFLVGYESKYFHDAESEDNWRVVSDATTGEWVREKPVGTWNTQEGDEGDLPYVQPNEDHTPGTGKTLCWVTGNASKGAGLGTADVDDGETYLTTRSYDVSAMRKPVLRYYRWYSNDAGATPGTDYWTVEISSDGGRNYGFLERTLESDASWQPRVFVLNEIIALTDDLVVKFTAADNEPGSLVEAAVDDFEILDINSAFVGVEDNPAAALSLVLEQNYPNPFNPSTTIRYTLPSASQVRLTVTNPLGETVATLVDGAQGAGTHSVTFDARDLPSGLYVYELRSGQTRLSRKMMLLE